MQPSSLVQEAFLRLLPGGAGSNVPWQNRAHFAVASQVMRHVLVDHARERLRQKRGVAPFTFPSTPPWCYRPSKSTRLLPSISRCSGWRQSTSERVESLRCASSAD
jgi:hypothetical protein